MLKVLWLSGSALNSKNRKEVNANLKATGGWLYALEESIKQRIELHVAFPSLQEEPSFEFDMVNYHPIYVGNKYWKYVRALFTMKRVSLSSKALAVLRRVDPDVVHIHGTENVFFDILEENIGKPIVTSIQGNITVYRRFFNKGFLGRHRKLIKLTFLRGIPVGWHSFNRTYSEFKYLSSVERVNMKKVKYYFGRTDWDRRIVKVLANEAKYYYGGELLRNEFYNSPEWSNPYKEGTLRIYTTISDNYYKGINSILECVVLLKEKGVDFQWSVGGVDNDSLVVKVLRKYYKLAKLPKELNLLGNMNAEEIRKELIQTNVYAMLSHIENSPNSLCEAMLLGVPCISTHVGGTSSLISNGVNGVLVQDSDVWSVVGAILELTEDENSSVILGANARRTALDRHDKQKIVDEYILAYQDILKDYKFNC